MLPKCEGEFVVSSTTTLGTFVGASVSIAAGRYFLTSAGTDGSTAFLTYLKNQLDAATSRTWTVTIADDTDTASGKVTLSVSGAATTATWSSSSLRDILGFDTNLSSGTSWTGANQATTIWLPNCGRSGVMSPEGGNGAIESDASFALAPSGAAYSIGYTARYVDTLEFRTLTGNKVWDYLESTGNESLETFWGAVIKYGRAVRLYPSRDTDGTYRTFRLENFGEFRPMPVIENWTESANSLWGISYRARKYV